jgi:hypothetical protein
MLTTLQGVPAMAKSKAKVKVPVSERAVLQRVNRKLAPQYEALRKWRSAGYQSGENWEPGDIYHVDYSRNAMLEVKIDLESFARKLGVIADWETITE